MMDTVATNLEAARFSRVAVPRRAAPPQLAPATRPPPTPPPPPPPPRNAPEPPAAARPPPDAPQPPSQVDPGHGVGHGARDDLPAGHHPPRRRQGHGAGVPSPDLPWISPKSAPGLAQICPASSTDPPPLRTTPRARPSHPCDSQPTGSRLDLPVGARGSPRRDCRDAGACGQGACGRRRGVAGRHGGRGGARTLWPRSRRDLAARSARSDLERISISPRPLPPLPRRPRRPRRRTRPSAAGWRAKPPRRPERQRGWHGGRRTRRGPGPGRRGGRARSPPISPAGGTARAGQARRSPPPSLGASAAAAAAAAAISTSGPGLFPWPL